MFHHILVPLDGSDRAERALPVATHIARTCGGTILLLSVVTPMPAYTGTLAASTQMTGPVLEQDYKETTCYLKTMAKSEKLAGVPVITEVVYGSAAQAILEYAQKQEIDLVVMCSHGRTGFKRWVLGSVAHRLVHQSSIPVLVLNEREPGDILPRTETKHPFRVFVPLDGSPLAEKAILPAAHLAVALAAPMRGAVHLAQVVQIYPSTTTGSFVDAFNEQTLETGRDYLAHLVERLQTTMNDLKLTFSWSIACENGEADVAITLLNMAEHGEPGKQENMEAGKGVGDLIAISTHGRDTLERWVLGSVTERLLNSTRLPMLIIPPHKIG